MQILATYDLRSDHPQPYSAVLARAPEFGWYRWMEMSNGLTYQLPNTTLHGYFAHPDHATNSLDALIAAASSDVGYSIKLEKLAVVPIGIGRFRSDRRYDPRPAFAPGLWPPVNPLTDILSKALAAPVR